jgi:hypothetical protein
MIFWFRLVWFGFVRRMPTNLKSLKLALITDPRKCQLPEALVSGLPP